MKTMVIAVIAFLAFAGPMLAGPITTDVWDVNQGAVVTGSSPTHENGSNVNNIFGGNNFNGCGDSPTVTVFADFVAGQYGNPAGVLPVGTIHWVEWNTAAPTWLGSFEVYAGADGGTNARSFNHLTLMYKMNPSDSWTTFYTGDLAVPYPVLDPASDLVISENLASSILGQYFRAEFTQATAIMWAAGPRITELDGFAPEPATLALLGLGGLGLLLNRKRR
jgi:hypothetical protein